MQYQGFETSKSLISCGRTSCTNFKYLERSTNTMVHSLSVNNCRNFMTAMKCRWPSQRPKVNGLAELTNKTIIRILRGSSKWFEEFPATLWPYKPFHWTLIGETTFTLTYGSKVVAPCEVSDISPQVWSVKLVF